MRVNPGGWRPLRRILKDAISLSSTYKAMVRASMAKPGHAACALTLLAALLPAMGARAQEEGTLDAVAVTAQRRTQDPQQIGVAVSTATGDAIEAAHIRQPLDLERISASLSTMNATSDSTPLFLVRGIGLDDFNTNNSSGVGVYLDEVYASFPGFLTAALFDVERVEVLKGPQGTLYGRNTAGGAVNILSRQPTSGFASTVDVEFGRWGTTDITAAVSGPLSQSVQGRLAATWTGQGRGYQTDLDTGAHYGQVRRGGARALLDLHLGADAVLHLNLHYAFDHSVPSSPSTPDVEALVPPDLPFPVAGRLDSPPGGSFVRVGGLPLFRHEGSGGASAKAELRLGEAKLTAITAYDAFSDHSLDNYDGYPAADNNWTKDFQQWQLSQEVRLASGEGGPVDWIAGASFARTGYHCRDALDWTFVYGLANSITDAGKAITATSFVQHQQSQGLYAHANFHLGGRWNLVTGLRYTRDEVSFDGTTVDPTGLLSIAAGNSTGPAVPGTVLAALDDARSSRNLSYRLEPDFHLGPHVLLYASLASGYKGGIYYGQPAQVRVDWGYVRPEQERSLELGVKSRLLGDTLEWNAAVFDTRIRDRQSSLSLWAGPAGTQPLIAGLGNVPQAQVDGAESEATWRALRGLELRLGLTWLHGRVTRPLASENGLALFTPLAPGQMLPDAPALSATWALRFDQPAGQGLRLLGQVDGRYGGPEHPYLGDPTTFGRSHVLNGRLGLRAPEGRWEAGLWITNLTDTRPLTYAFAGSEGQRVSFYQQPRAFGLHLGYAFD